MKILAIDSNTKKPLANTKIQLQVRGKDKGYISLMTDSSGQFQLEDRYKGQQIATYVQGSIMSDNEWVKALDGVKLSIRSEGTQKV